MNPDGDTAARSALGQLVGEYDKARGVMKARPNDYTDGYLDGLDWAITAISSALGHGPADSGPNDGWGEPCMCGTNATCMTDEHDYAVARMQQKVGEVVEDIAHGARRIALVSALGAVLRGKADRMAGEASEVKAQIKDEQIGRVIESGGRIPAAATTRAAERGESVSDVVRRALARYARRK